MSVALLMLSLFAAVAAGLLAWATAGFWWALAAYAGVGAATMLLLAIVIAMQPSREAGQPSGLAKSEVAG